jgi:hypothetical protein
MPWNAGDEKGPLTETSSNSIRGSKPPVADIKSERRSASGPMAAGLRERHYAIHSNRFADMVAQAPKSGAPDV